MKKYTKFIFIGLFVFVLIWTFVFLWKKSRPVKVEYQIVTPVVGTIEKKTVATGKVEPRDEVLIKPQISGIVSEVCKEAGQSVKAGEVLAKVKVIPEMGTLSAAESRVNVAQINLRQTQKEYDRTKELYKGKVIASEEFERAETEWMRAKEELQNAQDNLEIVRDGIAKRSSQFSNTQIRATITGMILDVPIKVGNSVIQSNNFNDGTTIATIADMSDMIFKGKIDETEVGRIKEGMPLTLTIGALQDMKFNAILEYISPKSIEENGAILFEIKAAAEVPDSVFVRAGYSANAEIILDRCQEVLTIPESTVEFQQDSTFVQVVTAEEPELELQRRYVKLGLSDGINIQVKEGLTTSDKIRGGKIVKQ
ncbi:RND transporter MFP subunit [Odoribacter laneus]|jgi:efflux transporter, RND family, MFP subunit|uniref:Efflux transporter, RND family, MFP subunit n=1 Tax=Odoribacter laneus YIT 12061 TaxID=742817 RepID=H1DI04_9BACT|nr:efflux RND transporter periplasmic adaptor subunit [Odoribacter laneus]EHP46875.1 efflux transporter, RND family, MFP subunit [Odoribacter laneus YIT 12061]GKI21680.1 RND transporter MFP subunit [Odoribacter laneus]GKI26262.1 RND transporter MFP subunit [Odoribacter laneus]CCZ82581.1 efflux transporter RND family MFP subunit [Odoribacter laneus CAG:561]